MTKPNQILNRFAGAVAALSLSAGAVFAGNCAPRETVVERLEDKFGEQLTSGGLNDNASKTNLVEIWSSAETGTFTVLLTQPNGVSCVVATGEDYFTIDPKEVVKSDPAVFVPR